MNELLSLKEKDEAPEWLTEEGFVTLKNGYLLPFETPRQAFKRVAKAAALHYPGKEIYYESKFFDLIWKNYLGLSSPILANMGTSRGLPCSCNSIHVGDSINSIFAKVKEFAHLTSKGAGVGVYLGDIRAKGEKISSGGFSEGVIPWAKVFDSTTIAVSQAGTRRGANAFYLPIEHKDAETFLHIRRHTGDLNLRALNSNHAFTITDKWMEDLLSGDKEKRLFWSELLKTRVETGEPYLMFYDNVNKANPEAYKKNNLKVQTSNICSEIVLYTDENHSFNCILSSLNLIHWDQIKNSDAIETAILFLDAVVQEYIDKTENLEGFQDSRNSAIKGRAIGLGVMGWHTLLQAKNIAFDSFQAMMLNAEIFSTIKERAEKTSRELALLKGEPEWCKGTGMRNTHLLAVAPTVSNSTISGGISPSVEPWAANIFVQKTAKGNFIKKNKFLEQLLEQKRKNTPEVWSEINKNQGSVQFLPFLSKEEKELFLTFREINQHAIVKQAAQRQKWIDQAQSINLAFAVNSSPKYIHDVHIEAWKNGLKTLYYLRSEGVLKGDLAFRSIDECKACEG